MKETRVSALDDAGAVYVLEQLETAGYEAYLVGGCVRDGLLQRPIQDIDITTSARPEQVMDVFPRTAPTGLAHGTVTVILPQGVYEVTTFRAETEYVDFRRPAQVSYISDLTEDLRRRDFTMNAMAMNRSGAVIDPFGGRQDAAAGLLRCVGAAAERFGEDALRMLRCIRFAAAYGQRIEDATWRALLAQAPLLRHVAMERVRSELARMVEGAAPAQAVRLLLDSGLWRHFKRPLELPLARWQDHDAALDGVAALQQPHERWALLLLLLETPAAAVHAALQQLTFARADAEAIVSVLGLAQRLAELAGGGAAEAAAAEPDPPQLARVWKMAAVRHGSRAARALLAVLPALSAACGGPQAAGSHPAAAPSAAGAPSHPPLDAADGTRIAPGWLGRWVCSCAPLLRAQGARWLSEIPCFSVKELAVSGTEVTETLARRPGPWLGLLLDALLVRTALGELENERAALLQAASELAASSA